MTTKKKLIIIGVVIWLFGSLYLGSRAIQEMRSDLKDAVEGRKTFDGDGMWHSLKGIMFPSVLLEEKEDKEEK